ncbi:hypothetical protein E4P40_16105 [Blastococcus sp. CT_GayMR20]|uniref:TetR/AcrR family transcriptional regulator C-terminal ligand-binding domain-containing protein n=1 Tax=Blastococcus sp. CT_GayMR20 TaxID=2559609 RepID=UPI0010733D62|nr:TetR/AcrR family transcriptional regulator C-terminal ligand-binding domain-containing protein [Blastococcus sp. CT_GayMR20]TFV81356.1 hypothetical protein E4P40_15960 [Blastococcus sp. CT_GayMR20]TFV81379.1 hypothetical protein E4P40_16105 [Blastococcus sp. CT_GayMR20]
MLQAVLGVLADSGYERLTLEAVRERAGSAGALLEADDLDDLVVIALQHVRLFDVPEPTGSLRGDLESLLRPWLGGRRFEDKVIAGLLSAAEWDGKLRDAVHDSFDRPLAQAVGAVLARTCGRELPAPDVQTLNWILRGLALNRLRAKDARAHVDLDRLVEYLLAGLPPVRHAETGTVRA